MAQALPPAKTEACHTLSEFSSIQLLTVLRAMSAADLFGKPERESERGRGRETKRERGRKTKRE